MGAPPAAVTLETKCWENDWRRLLTTNRLEILAERNRFRFAERVLTINNVSNYARVCEHAQRAVDRGWISKFLVVKDHVEEALRFFQIDPASLGRGYVYSSAELVSIYRCDTPYLLHYAGDCLPAEPCDWIPAAIAAFGADSRLKVANLTWDHKYDEARAESIEETNGFVVGYGFSDQCWLVRVEDFRAPIYNEQHPASARYPSYGGELFEKRVDAWMRNGGHLRATCTFGTYVHERAAPRRSTWQRVRHLLGRTRRRLGA